jgi:hypothetical protein
MAHYFSYVPNFDYISNIKDSKINDYIQIKNFFKRGKIFEEIFNDVVFFEKYIIKGDERPDNLAARFYGDATLDWVIFLSNNIINVQNEWPMPQKVFDRVMLQKYGSYENLYSGIHHYETIEIKDSRGRTILEGGKRISPTWTNSGNFVVIEDPDDLIPKSFYYQFYDAGEEITKLVPSNDFIRPVTNYDYEINKEERKREIFILKNRFLTVLLENIEEVMTYKEGGTQFINRKLKRGDNSRIYNH